MKKTRLIALFAVIVSVTVLSVGMAMALSLNQETKKEKRTVENYKRDEMPNGIIKNKPENELTKVLFIRYAPDVKMVCDNDNVCEKKENPKSCPNDCKQGGDKDQITNSCYDFLSKSKSKWNWTEDYYYETGLEYSNNSVTKWNNAAQTMIFGDGINEDNLDWGVYDNKNSISLGNYPEDGVLGVTAVWYQGKNIYEYDIMFDTDYFPFGSHDLDTVILHEFGHAAGMGDLYDTTCMSEVMYGYLGEGEVKTDLTDNDITGIKKLYK